MGHFLKTTFFYFLGFLLLILCSVVVEIYWSLEIQTKLIAPYLAKYAPSWIGPDTLRIGIIFLLFGLLFSLIFSALKLFFSDQFEPQIPNLTNPNFYRQRSRSISKKDNNSFLKIGLEKLYFSIGQMEKESQKIQKNLEKGFTPEVIKLVRELNNKIVRLSHITKTLLRIDTIQQSGEAVSLKEISLKPSLENICSEFLPYSNQSGVRIDLNYPGEDIKVLADSKKLEDALRELLKNSYQHTEKGFISIDVKKSNRFITIDVSDTGKGMKSNKELLQPIHFFRNSADPDSKNFVGMGLALANTLIQKQGGKLMVRNKPDGGVRATIFLPVN